MSTVDTDVIIVGAGPAGLVLAGELRLANVRTLLVERHEQRPDVSRGFTLNARSLDLLARRGLADHLVDEGWKVSHAAFSGLPVALNLDGATTDHPFTLGIAQLRVEEILEQHAIAAGTEILRGHRVSAVEQDEETVTATVATASGDRKIRASYVVGCDGGRSTVRKQAGIDFPGTAARTHSLLGDVVLADPRSLPYGVCHGPGGSVFAIPRPGYIRVITEDFAPPEHTDDPVTLPMLQEAVDHALGRHVELTEPRWLTRFGDAARQAAQYRQGRILVAGDAAHIHPPAGAIGADVALDDAFNLGWKLAAAVRDPTRTDLLDTYHAERHPVGANILANTRTQVLLSETQPSVQAVKDLLARVVSRPDGNQALTEIVTGLDTTYDVGADEPDAHPWVGRLVPDLRLDTDRGRTQLSTLLASGRPILLQLDGRDHHDATCDHVETVTANCAQDCDASAVLIRPDGHAVWVRTSSGQVTGELNHALRRWSVPTRMDR